MRVLVPHRHQAHHQRRRKERNRTHNILAIDPAAPPPRQQKQHERKHHDGRLRQQSQHEQQHRRAIPSPLPAVLEPQVGENREQVEHHRERVLPLRNPRHGRYRDRMDGEDEPRQQRPRHPQPLEHPPHEHGRQRVQEHVRHVVRGGVGAPEPPLQPPRTVPQGPVIRGLSREPEPVEPIARLDQRVLCEKQIIIPDKTRFHRRDIGEGRQKNNGGCEQNRTAPRRGGRGHGRVVFLVPSCGHWPNRLNETV